AWMRTRTREVEPVDAAEAARPGPLDAGQHLAVEDVPPGQPKALLELAWPEHEPVDDPLRQPRADLGEARDRHVGGGTGVHVDREALAEERGDVAARRRQRRIGRRLTGSLAPRLGRWPPRAGGVGRLLPLAQAGAGG